MKRLALLTTALVALTSFAFAADMATKAPPATPFLNYNGSGFYWGIGSTTNVDASSVNGNVFAGNLVSSNLTAAGASIDGELGYIWGNASLAGFANWARVYASGGYQNVNGGTVVANNAASVVSRWHADEGVDVNADLVQYVLNVFNWQNPFPSFTPQLPSNVAVASSPRQYVGVFVEEFGLGGNFGSASGTSWAAAPGVRTGFLWQTIGTNGKPNGMALDMGVKVSWPTKGVTFNNVGGPNPTVNASVAMGTMYGAYMRLDF